MKRTVITIITGCMMLAGCHFSEECVYYGTLQMTCREGGEKVMVLFPLIDGVEQPCWRLTVNGDTIIRQRLLTGIYDAGVFSGSDYHALYDNLRRDVLLEPADSLTEVSKDTVLLKKLPKPLIGISARDVIITHADTTKADLPVQHLSQDLELRLIAGGRRNGRIVRVEGTLSGIAIGRYLFSHKVGDRSAAYRFPTKEVSADSFHAVLRFAGIHRSAANILTVTLTFEDGQSNVCTMDLTERLKSFHTEKAVLTLNIETGEYLSDISIADWTQENRGEIQTCAKTTNTAQTNSQTFIF